MPPHEFVFKILEMLLPSVGKLLGRRSSCSSNQVCSSLSDTVTILSLTTAEAPKHSTALLHAQYTGFQSFRSPAASPAHLLRVMRAGHHLDLEPGAQHDGIEAMEVRMSGLGAGQDLM